MLDIRLIRENPEMIRKNLVKRRDPDKEKLLEDLILWDRAWRKALAEADGLKRRRNEITKEIAAAKKAGKSTDKLRKEAAALPKKIEALDREIDDLAAKVRDGLMRLPNLLDESVPVGKDDTENVEVSRWGTPRSFDYELRPHGELLEALKFADFERARKIAGAGFVYLMGDLVRLDQALLAFALAFMVKQGFTPVFPPFMMRRSAYEGVVDLGDFESVMYKVQGEDLYLIATSEHPIGAMYMDEVIDDRQLPLRFAGLATQFRREIGAHGVDTKGLFRMHQFNKIEQFVFCRPEESPTWHEKLRANGEGIYRDVGASHRRDVHGRGDRRPPAAPPLRRPGDPVPPGDRGPRRRHEGPLPHAPVQQDRTVRLLPSGGEPDVAREAPRERRGDLPRRRSIPSARCTWTR